MSTMQSLLAEVRATNAIIADRQSILDGYVRQGGEQLMTLRARIIAGETTDDPFLDSVIVNFKTMDEKTIDFLRNLDARARSHADQYVLTIDPYIVPEIGPIHLAAADGEAGIKKHGVMAPPGPETRYHLGLGVLNGGGLDLTHKHGGGPAVLRDAFAHVYSSDPEFRSLRFPTPRAAYLDSGVEAADQPLTLTPLEVARLLPSWRTGLDDFLGRNHTPKRMEVMIGNEEVFVWFREHYGYRTHGAQMCELIGGPANNFPGYQQYRDRRRSDLHNDLAKLQQEENRRATQSLAEEVREEIRQKLEQAINAGFGQDEQIVVLCQQYGITIPA